MTYLLPLITSFIFSIIAIMLLKPVAFHFQLVDRPNKRKLHNGSIPLIGGITIFFGVALSLLIFVPINETFFYYLTSAFIILILGVGDDKFDLSVRGRLLIQVLTAMLMTTSAGFYLHDFGNIFYFFKLELGSFGVIITVFAVIACINAFNMIDGIDGLAGMLSLITFTALTILLTFSHPTWAVIPIIFIGSLLAYLIFNLRWPFKNVGKIFLGDAGSMLVGLTIVWLLVIGVESETQAFRPVTALYLIAIPLMDMAAIMIRRIKKGTSPFKADREHLHHIFERAGISRKRTLIYIALCASIIATAGVVSEFYLVPEWIMLVGFVGVFLLYNYALIHSWKIIRWYKS
ncbi:UDP-N-acetylglucosamine--undecaprenyl-phosphate N-acetylglucosaminephosphotransferase [Thalassotalea nanhaiensis]|uniref:Undecaprenyl-phosphate alpha-N-acetylglucosaminyl 1-phosphate transferase n=1 Tax=Thalassotalea nanhaiensis TaxID=3065648 RepID=A0ABY9TL52_9GAMM|nr:UDP-N-acetylglucosamine--undecaprenyl-phosphate N-acetylglucosaminephosphotransferase [Colwelliaceae bacterium SQ345]